jgi:hypothetical protein
MVTAESSDGKPPVSLVSRLRKQFTIEQVAAVLDLVLARWSQRQKFPLAEKLFLTRLGGEQATDALIAQYKARRFNGYDCVADVGCGIGGDAMAIARVACCIAIEQDPTTAYFASKNLQIISQPERQQVFEEDAFAADAAWPKQLGKRWAWHVDPDRRVTGEKVTTLELCSPGPENLRELLRRSPSGAAKVAPATQLDETNWPRCEREWISRDGECRQQVVWFGELAKQPGMRVATAIRPSIGGLANDVSTFAGWEPAYLAPATRLGSWLVEPDATILAAGLKNAFAEAFDLAPIAEGIGYLTGSERAEHALASSFEILEVWPFDARKVGEALRARNVGTIEIKKRGVDDTPEALRKQWRLTGDESATVILTPTPSGVVAILCRRFIDD